MKKNDLSNQVSTETATQTLLRQNLVLSLSNIQTTVHSHHLLSQQIQQVAESLKKPKPKALKKTPRPRRDALLRDTLDRLLNYKLESNHTFTVISHAQFRITLVLLYLTGARLNEIRDLELTEIEEFPKTKRICISESKTGKSRTCRLGAQGLKLLGQIEGDVD